MRPAKEAGDHGTRTVARPSLCSLNYVARVAAAGPIRYQGRADVPGICVDQGAGDDLQHAIHRHFIEHRMFGLAPDAAEPRGFGGQTEDERGADNQNKSDNTGAVRLSNMPVGNRSASKSAMGAAIASSKPPISFKPIHSNISGTERIARPAVWF